MKQLLFLIILLSFVPIFSKAQNTDAIKRKPYKLKIQVDKETFYEEDLPESEYIHPDNTIQLYPGENIFVEIEKKDGVVTKATAVGENTHPEKTLIISFTQTTEGNVHSLMMLKVTNPFQEELNYEAMIFLLKQKRWAKTSVLPVQAGLSSFESWPDIIVSIGLGHLSFK